MIEIKLNGFFFSFVYNSIINGMKSLSFMLYID